MNEHSQIATTDDGEVTVEYVNRVQQVRSIPIGSIAVGVMVGNILTLVMGAILTVILWGAIGAALLDAASK